MVRVSLGHTDVTLLGHGYIIICEGQDFPQENLTLVGLPIFRIISRDYVWPVRL